MVTLAKTAITNRSTAAPENARGRSDEAYAEKSIDPAQLRTELGEKQRLLNILESKGVELPQVKQLRAEIDSALGDLETILAETEDV